MNTLVTAAAVLLASTALAAAQHHGHGNGHHHGHHRGPTITNNPQAVGIGQATAGAASQSSSAASANNALTFNNPGTVSNFNRVRQSGSLDTTANAYAPQLAASAVNTCLGSSSLGFGITGFGLSGGSTYPDRPCNLRMYSALLLSMGQKNAAAAVLCHDPYVYNSFAAVGVPCPIVPDGYRVVGHPVGVQPYQVSPTVIHDQTVGVRRNRRGQVQEIVPLDNSGTVQVLNEVTSYEAVGARHSGQRFND